MYNSEGRTAARKLLLEKTYEQFDRTPPPPIALLRDGAKQLVPGLGTLDPLAVLVGEAPGKREDLMGVPFVGNSGKFLDNLLVTECGVHRDQLWITNVVKYRPEGNRTPYDDEI